MQGHFNFAFKIIILQNRRILDSVDFLKGGGAKGMLPCHTPHPHTQNYWRVGTGPL